MLDQFLWGHSSHVFDISCSFCFTDKTQNKKKKPEGANSSKDKKPSKASKLAGPQLLPLIQSLETAETKSIQSDSYSQSSVIQSVPVVIDSEESSLDSLPGVEFKSRFLQKLSDKGREICLDSNRPFHELKSSQSSVSSTNSAINNVPSFKGKTDNQSNKDLNSNYANNVPVRHSQETDSQESSQNSIQSLSSVSSLASIQSLPKPDFVLRPGEFDVILCVDNAEYYGA